MMNRRFSPVFAVLLAGVSSLSAQFNITTNTTNTPQTTAAGNNFVQAGVVLTLTGNTTSSSTVTVLGNHTFTNNGTTSSSRDADVSGEVQDAVAVTGNASFLVNNGLITQTGNAVSGSGARTINALRITGSGLQLANNGVVSTTGTNTNETMQTIFVGAGGLVLTNNGTISATGGPARAIESANSDLGTVTIVNNAGAVIRATSDDAIRIRAGTTINLTNNGTIYSGPDLAMTPASPVVTGQALDFTSAEGGNLTNSAGALIRADGADAVRLGSNQTLTNFGTIRGSSVINDSSANNQFNSGPSNNSTAENFATSEGVSFEDGNGSSLDNYGTISGSRHGVESAELATNVTITNRATGEIIGRNGSGIGFDSTSASATNVTVNNYGLIRGDYAGVGNVIDRTGNASFTNDGDGDGVDVDGAVTINNFASGQILSTGAGGFDTGGRANNSEAIAIGGGIVVNWGVVRGAGRGILVNNDSNANRSALAATQVTNEAGGVIEGQNGFAVRFEGSFNDTLTNNGTIIGSGSIPVPSDTVLRQNGLFDPNSSGTLDGVTYTGTGSARFIRGDGSAIQTGEGNDVLDNRGTIIGSNGRAVNLEGGDDTMIVRAGSRISGLVNGGAHATGDTLELHINGLTEEKRVLLEAGQTVTVGGITFTNFESVSGNSTSVSYASFSESSTTAGVADVLDNAGPGATEATLALLDRVDASSDPDAAMSELTPISYESVANILLNNALFRGSQINSRLDDVREGGPRFDLAGVRVWDGKFDLGLQRTERLLADIGQSRARMADLPQAVLPPQPALPEERWGAFLNGNAFFAEQGATAELQESDYFTAALTGGMDYRFTENFTAGFFAGYAHTDADLDAQGSTSEINTVSGGAYATFAWDDWFIDGVVGYGHSFIENDRRALGTSNTSSPESDSIQVQGRFGRDFLIHGWTLTPSLGLSYTHVTVEEFTEDGPAALRLEEDVVDSFRSQLGGSIARRIPASWGAITPQVRAFWVHEYLNDRRDIRASFVDTALPGTFNTPTANADRDFGVFGAGLTAEIGTQWTLHLDYDVEAGREEFLAHQVQGGVRFEF